MQEVAVPRADLGAAHPVPLEPCTVDESSSAGAPARGRVDRILEGATGAGIRHRLGASLVVEDLEAYYTETRTHRDNIDDLELMGKWFWEDSKAGRLLLLLEAVSVASDNRVMRQIVEMSLMAPRFWSEGPLPGTSAAGW